MNLKKNLWGIPLFVWVVVAVLIVSVVAATVISNILTTNTNLTGGTTPVQITWSKQIPAASAVGQSYPWAISTSASNSYSPTLPIDLSRAISPSEPSVIMVRAGSPADRLHIP